MNINRQWRWILRRITLLTVLLAAVLLTTSCKGLKDHLKPGERALNKNSYVIVMPDGEKPPKEIRDALSNMKKYTGQKPNSHLLGFGPRFSMRLYCLSNPKKKNFWNKYLRKKGQAPVIYDINSSIKTCSEIENLLQSKGCFSSKVSFDSVTKNKYDIDIVYNIHPTPRYKISEVNFRAETETVDSLLNAWRNESLLKEGAWYDQELMDQERTRITNRLRESGYYYASTNLISYYIDTAHNDKTLSINLKLKNPLIANSDKQLVSTPLQRYRIDNIYVYPNTPVSSNGLTAHHDTITSTLEIRNNITTFNYLFTQPMTLNHNVISRSLFLYRGQTYRPSNIERTYSSLSSLRNFKYINIELSESPFSTDTNRLLDAKVRLLNSQRQRLSLSLEVNNSSPFGQDNTDNGFLSGNFGTELKLSYQNKNFFGGAELFKAELSLLAELPKMVFKQTDDDFKSNIANFENGLNFSIDFPTFVFPFTRNIMWQRMRPHTMVTFGGNYQLHSYFERMLANIGFGYNWSRNRNSHMLLPFEMTYVNYFSIDSVNSRLLSSNDARIKYQYSNHFILDARYEYTFNSQQYGKRENFDYLHLSLETAGSLLNAISVLTDGKKKDDQSAREIFGVPYSQYVRLTSEYKHYFYFGKSSTIVTRAMIGIGIPYSNSKAMPYEKGFFGGGPTTIRAWRLRQLGPGLYHPDSSDIDRFGDIQLVMNLEYRFPLFSIFEGALFTDMGNVWLTHPSEEYPGGVISFKDFFKSIATGIGVGLRANISIVTVRFDVAIPLYDPGMESSERWRPPKWKHDQLSYHFGIDYPF